MLADVTVLLPDMQAKALVPGAIVQVEGSTVARLAGAEYAAIRSTITGERVTPVGVWAEWVANATQWREARGPDGGLTCPSGPDRRRWSTVCAAGLGARTRRRRRSSCWPAAFTGRFCTIGFPWVRRCDRPGWFWLDGEPLLHDTGAPSGGERRLLAVAGALVSGLAIDDLGGIVAGLDRDHLALVLTAPAHAGGSHEHVDCRVETGTVTFTRLAPLVAWPAASAVAS